MSGSSCASHCSSLLPLSLILSDSLHFACSLSVSLTGDFSKSLHFLCSLIFSERDVKRICFIFASSMANTIASVFAPRRDSYRTIHKYTKSSSLRILRLWMAFSFHSFQILVIICILTLGREGGQKLKIMTAFFPEECNEKWCSHE